MNSYTPGIPEDYALALAAKAYNDTAGPRGLSPTFLVFGIYQRLPFRPHLLPDNCRRMNALRVVKQELACLLSQERISTALARRVSSAVDVPKNIGDEILWYRGKPIEKWMGPFIVTGKEGQLLHIDDKNRTATTSADRVKPYFHKDLSESVAEDNKDPMNHLNTRGESQSTSPDTQIQSVLNRRLNAVFGAVSVNGSRNDEISIVEFVVELLKEREPRIHQRDVEEAKKKEIAGLCHRKIWYKVKRSVLQSISNFLGGRFIYPLKTYETPSKMAKVCYVAQGYSDQDKLFMVYNEGSLEASCFRIVPSTAACFCFRVFSHYDTQAYLQSKYNMNRDVFIDAEPKDHQLFNLAQNEVLQLNLPLYGVCDTGDYWGITINEHNENNLSMLPAPSDQSLYIKKSTKNGELRVDGVTGTYVDDSINAGNSIFQKLTELTLKTFELKP